MGEYVRLSEGTQVEMKELVQNQGEAETHAVGAGVWSRGAGAGEEATPFEQTLLSQGWLEHMWAIPQGKYLCICVTHIICSYTTT